MTVITLSLRYLLIRQLSLRDPKIPRRAIVKIFGLKELVRAIIKNPRSSLQDGLLLASVMLVAALLALEFNLFWFISVLSEPQRKISLAEAMFLTTLLALCIFAFVIRRFREERRDVVRHVVTKNQVRELRALALQELIDRTGEPSCAAQGVDGREHCASQ